VRHAVQQLQLLQRDLVNLVAHVDGWDVHPVALDDVDQVLVRVVSLHADVRVVDAVLLQDLGHRLQVQVCRVHCARKAHPSPLLALERNLRRLLVQPNAKPLQLVLNQALVRDGLERVEDDEDEVAGARGADHLPPAALAVFSALDDAGQVQQLDLGALVADDARDAGELRGAREGEEHSSWAARPRAVVNTYAACSECVPVSQVSSVDLPTEGKPAGREGDDAPRREPAAQWSLVCSGT
jgi:hypothetical protein